MRVKHMRRRRGQQQRASGDVGLEPGPLAVEGSEVISGDGPHHSRARCLKPTTPAALNPTTPAALNPTTPAAQLAASRGRQIVEYSTPNP